MKTKYVLTALCLPALFAACTNEDILVENGTQTAGKETVNMVLSANYGTDDLNVSRMVNQNGTFLWDNTDKLGATLLGKGNEIYSNNKFVNTLSEPSLTVDFTTEATTVVGQYLFYYPYSTNMTSDLQGVQYSLAEPQEYDPTGEKMMKNNFMIAPKVTVDGNEPGTLTLPITMRSIYGYGTLSLKLAEALISGGSYVTEAYVQKVVIKYDSNVETDGIINMEKVPSVDLTAKKLKELKENEDGDYYGMSDEEITEALLNEADYLLTARDADNDTYANGTILDLTTYKSGKNTNKISQVSISCLSDENPNGIKVTKDGGFSTRVLLPTIAQAGANVTVTVYTDKGSFATTTNAAKIKPNHTINLANINRTAGGESVITINSLVKTSDVVAISEEDFIASMKGVGANVNVEVGDFELTPAAIAAIPSTTKVTFTSDVKFNGDMTLKNMTFSKGVTLKGGNISVEKTVSFTTSQKITVDGANVTIIENAGAGSLVTEVKSGSLTLADGVNITSYIDVKGGTVNMGVPAQTTAAATTPKGISAYLRTIESGTVNINVPYTSNYDVTVGTADKAATLNVNADVTLSGKTITVNAKGIVNNKAELSVATNNGTINNEGELTITTSNAGNATINQMSGNAQIVSCTANVGKIVTIAGSETTVASNTGEIIYVDGARLSATGDGYVTYEAPADIKATDFINLSASITKIIFTADFTYTYTKNGSVDESNQATLPTKVTELEFRGNLTLGQNWDMSDVTAISFVGASADITGKYKITGKTDEFTLTVGVDEVKDVTPAVATKMYIGAGVTITKLSATPVLKGGASVWNDGTVEGKNGSVNAAPDSWKGNQINLVS